MIINENEFRDLLNAAKVPVVVDFFAAWCGPCRNFSPIFESASKKMEGYSFCKVDIDTAETVCEELGVQVVPTIMVFENNRMLAQHQGGFASDAELRKFVEKAAGK